MYYKIWKTAVDMAEQVIKCKNISKMYKLYDNPRDRVKEELG